MEGKTYCAKREITLEFPSKGKRLVIKAGEILRGEVSADLLHIGTKYGPARIPLALLEPVK